jgi:DNA-binding NarL/FixJ family response regulator
MVFEPIEPSWANFAAAQDLLANSRRIDCRYWGLEEALSETLKTSVLDPDCRQKFSTLRDNRTKKHRKRQQKLKSVSDTVSSISPANQHHQTDCEDVLGCCLPLLALIERQIFSFLAAGESYTEVADRLQLGVGQLKSKVHRARKRMVQLYDEVLV